MSAEIREFHAVTIPGTEAVLCEELRELGFKSVRLNRGGIPFRGPMSEGWRACLESRIAQRIQLVLARFPCRVPEDLYGGALQIEWENWITHRQTLSVSTVCRGKAFAHSGFAALKLKDAIVDRVRNQTGKRPDVDKEDADVCVFAHVANDKATVYLDLAGVPLHKRGYRVAPGEAPLRETLAAALLRMSGWDRKAPFHDPMCGSGTLAIEAALWARGVAPGILREQFGFERWANHDAAAAEEMRTLRGTLRQGARGAMPRIVAADRDPAMIEAARRNARTAGVKLAFRQHDVLSTPPPALPTGWIVTNPPYGVRLEMEPGFCKDLGAVLTRLHGWRIGIMAGSPQYQKAIAVPPQQVIPLRNGALDCAFLLYDMP